MSTTHVTNRFGFEPICAGILRLINRPSDFVRLNNSKFLDETYFLKDDNSHHANHLRFIIKTARIVLSESGNDVSKLSIPAVDQRISLLETNPEKAQEIKASLMLWMDNKSIKAKIEQNETMETLLTYLKAMQFVKHSQELSNNYQQGYIDKAAKSLQDILSGISLLDQAMTENINTSEAEVMRFLESNSKQQTSYSNRLFMGENTKVDAALGGFEPQTLTVFIAPTGGGKSAMCHHILRRAIAQKMYVHLFCVEDRYKSFLYKFLAAQTGIQINRLKKMDGLSSQERLDIKLAIQNLNEYVKVQFIYGHSIETIHQISNEYDSMQRASGKPVPIIHIVDYTMHIAGFSRGEKTHEKIRTAYADRKNFVLKHNKIGFDFAQVNREGNKRLREEALISHADLAGSYDLSQVCDNIISINRSAQDMQMFTATLHIAKARDGELVNRINIKTQFDKSRFDMEIDTTENATQKPSTTLHTGPAGIAP